MRSPCFGFTAPLLGLLLALGCDAEGDGDAGFVGRDGGGPRADAGRLDAGSRDGGFVDAASPDAAAADAAPRDAATGDAAVDAAGADAGAIDGGAPSAGLTAPTWWRSIQGVTTLGGPFAEVLPDGTAVLAMNGGYFSRTLTVGEGEATEVTFPVYFDPVVAWLDGDDGTLLRARHVAVDASASAGSSVTMRGVSVTAAGGLLAIGDFHGSSTFHPDTTGATILSAERLLVAGALHRAEDPYFTRWDATSQPEWTRRGRTPGPLSQTWFNYGVGIAALGDGGALVSGHFEASGFVVGDGTAGATTLAGTRQTYFARLDATGVPTMVARNTGDVRLWTGLRSRAGVAYALVEIGSTATLFADSSAPITIEPVIGTVAVPIRTLALVRFDAAGAIVWTRRVLLQGSGAFVADFEVRDDASVVLAGTAGMGVQLRDGADATTLTHGAGGFVASYTASGTPEWITAVGSDSGYEVAAMAAGDTWVATSALAGTTRVPTEDGDLTLPALGLPSDGELTLLHRVTRDGRVIDARVIGTGLGVRDLTSRRAAGAPGLVAAGLQYCHDEAPTPEVVGPAGTSLSALPVCASGANERAIVLSLAP